MRGVRKLQDKLTGLTDAIARYPLTTLFLIGAAFIDANMISTHKDNPKYLLTFIVGAFLSAVSQVAYERFFSKFSTRMVLMGVVVLLTAGYYLIIMQAPTLSMEIEFRTNVALFALLIAFIWVPVIKSPISFNISFMIAFKSFFNSLFFSGVIFGGISIILAAIDQLIFTIDSNAYLHTANIVFILFAPMYFLSLIPLYPRDEDKNEEKINRAAQCPKFLEILISYIVIPLTAVFTLILVIYIFKNIGGKFWTDNLLEPMIVSYAITIILLYILASEIENKFTAYFRKIFPKVLIPIVLFQVVSSVISLSDTGVTHTRYYVILFGIYSAIAGILLSFIPVRKNGVIAAILIIFAAVSIVPPVDAFTVSRNSQISTLKNALVKNDMLENNKIKPNANISNHDKKIITNAIQYLYMMEYTKKIDWLPDDFNAYEDFNATFGFNGFQEPLDSKQPVFLSIQQPSIIKITGFETFVQTDISMFDKSRLEFGNFEKAGKKYTLVKDFNQDEPNLILMGENNREILSFNTQVIFDKFADFQSGKDMISVEDATFSKENAFAKMTIVVQNINIEGQNDQNNNALLYVFVQIK